MPSANVRRPISRSDGSSYAPTRSPSCATTSTPLSGETASPPNTVPTERGSPSSGTNHASSSASGDGSAVTTHPERTRTASRAIRPPGSPSATLLPSARYTVLSASTSTGTAADTDGDGLGCG
nr:hypothetical protein GCM10020092_088370 [Actinoplanes digitatis]